MTKLKSSSALASGQLLQRAFSGVGDVTNQPAQPVVQAQAPQDQQAFDLDTQLDTLDKVVSEIEEPSYQAATASQAVLTPVIRDTVVASAPIGATGTVAQALPTAVAQAQDELNPPTPTRTAKEAVETTTPDTQAVETGTGIGVVEYEKSHELPPEVEGYLQKVQDHSEQAPKEIVIADGTQDIKSTQKFPSQPVIVIPITPETEKKGKRKNPKFSIRWLVEFSLKMMKAFAGKVIYREVGIR